MAEEIEKIADEQKAKAEAGYPDEVVGAEDAAQLSLEETKPATEPPPEPPADGPEEPPKRTRRKKPSDGG